MRGVGSTFGRSGVDIRSGNGGGRRSCGSGGVC